MSLLYWKRIVTSAEQGCISVCLRSFALLLADICWTTQGAFVRYLLNWISRSHSLLLIREFSFLLVPHTKIPQPAIFVMFLIVPTCRDEFTLAHLSTPVFHVTTVLCLPSHASLLLAYSMCPKIVNQGYSFIKKQLAERVKVRMDSLHPALSLLFLVLLFCVERLLNLLSGHLYVLQVRC